MRISADKIKFRIFCHMISGLRFPSPPPPPPLDCVSDFRRFEKTHGSSLSYYISATCMWQTPMELTFRGWTRVVICPKTQDPVCRLTYTSTYRLLGYERVYLPLCGVAYTPFHIQGDAIYNWVDVDQFFCDYTILWFSDLGTAICLKGHARTQIHIASSLWEIVFFELNLRVW